MSELRYPNESKVYRDAREALRKDEQELLDKLKVVAARRRALPPGSELKEDYVFRWAGGGEAGRKLGERVKFSELFGGKNTLILYSWMFGPSWDKPCPSCTSLMDGFDRSWYAVSRDAAFAGIAKAPAERSTRAKQRGWSRSAAVGLQIIFQKDYKCQGGTDDMQQVSMLTFGRRDGKIFLFWSAEGSVDTVWPYWNLMDFTPEGRPDRLTPPQKFRPEFFEKNILNK
jgi:predicted dithiol-disulfide oxidoreductase (DUF899 family)